MHLGKNIVTFLRSEVWASKMHYPEVRDGFHSTPSGFYDALFTTLPSKELEDEDSRRDELDSKTEVDYTK